MNPRNLQSSVLLNQNHLQNLPEQSAATSLQAKGELALLKKYFDKGLNYFNKALSLEPTNFKLYFSQGLSLFQFAQEKQQKKPLLLANKRLKTAAQLNPNHLDIWQAWSSVLSALGFTYKNPKYFLEAHEKTTQAIDLCPLQKIDTLADLYADLGSIFLHIASYSQEPNDLHNAIQAFENAVNLNKTLLTDVWRDFGLACYRFASFVNEARFYFKANQYFKNALSLEPESASLWHLLAQTFCQLYTQTHDEDHFIKANEYFASAAQRSPKSLDIWLNWSLFLCETGKNLSDVKKLRLCIEKCNEALNVDPDHFLTQAICAEALSLLGMNLERLDLIHEANEKMSQIIEQKEDSPDIWHCYGSCLQCLGTYFKDIDFYYQAIEKFQIGLSINRTYHRNWHAIAKIYTAIGDLEQDADILYSSFKFYKKALYLKKSHFYLFDYAVALAKLGEMKHERCFLEKSIDLFEKALIIQKNAIFLYPEWLFHYACALDTLGDFFEEESYYLRSIEIFSQILMIDPNLYDVHHHLALALSHLGELTSAREYLYRAIHHYRLAVKQENENDTVLLDFALTLINLSQHLYDSAEIEQLYRDAEQKLFTASRLGNTQAYYHLACLYSLSNQIELSMRFLEKAVKADSLPPIEEMLQDDWLDNIRTTQNFHEFLSRLENSRNLEEY
ncbi:Tetratricopeptide repeat [Candidatus Rhabdochlamydia oedothoracis]|uniref:Tetratricopeptide repeat n=1 Tax=Candidatus Rhabdochlamydia oedothoracis TaxID=2720720 RepID=A0ABX8V5Q0_9BACT|nr:MULTISPECIES: hypothetical protein [Rhabdochlamydia]KAG6559031.1 hypothetical protein RHOW815_000980 [Candidatus Rhabdochlamydia sp. W815]MCL6756256.1 hypothetical protein [Candidatus Rhabdochlamydia oedothoracis]QYF48785.1 Tetratricopeptide repeat [Candidatus Rhabdochlamydia oedothoracis]